jgi:CheY-like chemotaxis protein
MRIAPANDVVSRAFPPTVSVRRVRVVAPRRMHPTKTLAGRRVLVVDDDSASRDLLTAILVRAGANVHGAASAEEALEAMPGFRPHLLVSDIGMPGQDGYALIRRVRALGPEAGGLTPAIALTGFSSARDQRSALEAGFYLHLTKPVDANELLSAASSLIRARGAAHH